MRLHSGSVRSVFAAVIFGLAMLLVAGCAGPRPAPTDASAAGTEADPKAQPSIRITPESGSDGVSPIGTVKATAVQAELTEVVMTNASGERVEGAISGDSRSWSVGEPLGYGKTYTVVAEATTSAGKTLTARSEFTTLNPEHLTYVSMTPLDGQEVGIGQPLIFYFSEDAPAPDKDKAEQAIEIRTEPSVQGAFYWFNDREVHWRPKEYWEPGTKITVNVDIYGKNLGNGVYGQADRTATFTIGDAVVLHADGKTHRMTFTVNGETVRTFPISMGRPEFPTHNGVHVVMRKSSPYVMDSRTFGLGLDEGGYVTEVKWAVRISNGGEFLHSAPWSVDAQGERNVSHGCINLAPADAKWVYQHVQQGDIVKITNSGGPPLPSWDGFGDWQIPWSEWVTGNR